MELTSLEIRERTERLQVLLRERGLAGCLITQNVGLYYWTGSMQTGYAFIPADGEPSYYVRRSLERAQAESFIRVAELGAQREFGKKLAMDYPHLFGQGELYIGGDLDVMPAQLYLRLKDAIKPAEWKDASGLLREVRSVKSAYEVACIRGAAEAAGEALESVLGRIQEGITELEVIALFEKEIRLRGHSGLMRMRGYNQEIMTGVVAAGEAAAEPSYFDGPAGGRGLGAMVPQSASTRTIRKGEPILLDVGCCIEGYTIDQTRTAVIGDLPEELMRAYDVSVSIIRHVESRLRAGAIPEDLYRDSLRLAEEAGLAGNFMGYGADQVKFLGHGIGLEIDEWPVLARGFSSPLQSGTVLAIEPKFTFPGLGVVGIENTYLVQDEGYETLTVSPEHIYRLPAGN